MHNISKTETGTKRKSSMEESLEEPQSYRIVKKKRDTKPSNKPGTVADIKFIHISDTDLHLVPADLDTLIPEGTTDSSGRSTPVFSLFDVESRFSSGITSPRSISPTPTDQAEMPWADFEPEPGSSTPLSSFFDMDAALSAMDTATLPLSPLPRDDFAFGAPEEQPPYCAVPTEDLLPTGRVYGPAREKDDILLMHSTFANLSMDEIDLVLRTDTPELEPMENPHSLGSARESDRGKTDGHGKKPTRIVIKVLRRSQKADPANRPEEGGDTASQHSPANSNLHPVDRLLDKWGRDDFYVQWLDGTCSWEPRKNIEDPNLIKALNKTHRGLHHGVDVLGTRRDSGGVRYQVHWKGDKWPNQWLHEKYMSRALIRKYGPSKTAKRRRRG